MLEGLEACPFDGLGALIENHGVCLREDGEGGCGSGSEGRVGRVGVWVEGGAERGGGAWGGRLETGSLGACFPYTKEKAESFYSTSRTTHNTNLTLSFLPVAL